VALLDPDELLARLERRLPLLTSHNRDSPARQRTLRAAISWSDELLHAEEQVLFRRLAVFAGSFTMSAAETVCDADMHGLESLVLKSLVRRWDGGRLGMLETIREYALEQMEDAPYAQDVHHRHALFFLRVAESANLNAGNMGPGGWRLHIALEEQHNIRAALAWTLASGAIELGLDIATAMETFWILQTPQEGTRWFGALLEHPSAAAVSPYSRAHALRACGSSTDIAGEDAAAERLYERSLALFGELGDAKGRAVLLHRLRIQAMRRGELPRARELVDESHAIHLGNDDRWGLAQTTGTMGAIARDHGNGTRAQALLLRSAALARETGVQWWEGGMRSELAMLKLGAGDVGAAETCARESLAIADQSRDRSGRVFGVGVLAVVAAERGDPVRGSLVGRHRGRAGRRPLGGWRRHRRACEARIRAAGGLAFDRACIEGRALSLDEAVSIATECQGPPQRT
jgi:hypothetical protein